MTEHQRNLLQINSLASELQHVAVSCQWPLVIMAGTSQKNKGMDGA